MTNNKSDALGRDVALQCPPCTGDCRQGRDCNAQQPMPAEACTDAGMEDHRFELQGQRWGLVLILLPWALLVMTWALIAAYKN